MRLIDADALKIDYGFTWDDITPTHDEMYALIDRQPTIEEQKNGEWIKYKGMIYCSNCANSFEMYFINDFIYCPHCKAYMRGEQND